MLAVFCIYITFPSQQQILMLLPGKGAGGDRRYFGILQEHNSQPEEAWSSSRFHHLKSPPPPPLSSSTPPLLHKDNKRFASMSLKAVTENIQSNMETNLNSNGSSGPMKPEKGAANSSTSSNNGNLTVAASASASSLSKDGGIGSTTRDTEVVLITLTIIFFTLIATYFLWKRHRGSGHFSVSNCKLVFMYSFLLSKQNVIKVSVWILLHYRMEICSSRLEEYRYSRLSQNDAEVDNISFQGDLTHKTLMNSVPVCAEEDPEDDQVRGNNIANQPEPDECSG